MSQRLLENSWNRVVRNFLAGKARKAGVTSASTISPTYWLLGIDRERYKMVPRTITHSVRLVCCFTMLVEVWNFGSMEYVQPYLCEEDNNCYSVPTLNDPSLPRERDVCHSALPSQFVIPLASHSLWSTASTLASLLSHNVTHYPTFTLVNHAS